MSIFMQMGNTILTNQGGGNKSAGVQKDKHSNK